ncbi:hypothetical protein F4801DRAFT_546795 [Xylaria longipes]|nr:hypothetical protein F4801DRAFT_546795 [Xylaria longipes]
MQPKSLWAFQPRRRSLYLTGGLHVIYLSVAAPFVCASGTVTPSGRNAAGLRCRRPHFRRRRGSLSYIWQQGSRTHATRPHSFLRFRRNVPQPAAMAVGEYLAALDIGTYISSTRRCSK